MQSKSFDYHQTRVWITCRARHKCLLVSCLRGNFKPSI